MQPFGLFFIAVGAFSILGGICNWDWFMNARKAKFIVKLLTRNGARIFYCVLGLFVLVLGILFTMGIVDIQE